tara:strand:+ start:76 stop:846 length:771 start_codon:yes stop_codon:yes gene_type:complete
MKNFFLEAGINHFGKIREADKILNFFFNSELKNITFMIHTKKFYEHQKKRGINFKLSTDFYKKAIKESHLKKKRIGLSVCDDQSFKEVADLKFDFYKLLGVGINNLKLISMLKSKKKQIFISTSFNASDQNIKRCLNFFKNNTRLTLLHSPMTYSPNELNLSKINVMRKKFKLKVGYSNHNNDINNILVLSAYNPEAIFIYCKQRKKKNRVYPDHGHAFYFDELQTIIKKYSKYVMMHKKLKSIKKVKIFANEFKI